MNARNDAGPWSGIPLPRTVQRAYGVMLRLCDITIALVLALEMSLVTINVISRYFFFHTFGWMNEFAQYSLLWLFVPGSVVLLDRYGLFYAEVLLLFIESVTIRKIIFVCNSLVMLVFFAAVFWTGIDYVKITWNFELDYAEIPKWVFYVSMPAWGLMMLLVIVKKLLGLEDPDLTELDPEAADATAPDGGARP